MKKIVTGTFVAIFLALGLTLIPAIPALAADPVLGISGTVTDKDTVKPVAGANVQVSCDGTLVFSSTTDSDGTYSVPADSLVKCQVGGDLTITASKDDKSDVYTSTSMGDVNIIDLTLKEHINVPEYSWLGAIFAGSIAIGAAMFIRRRTANIV